MISALVLAYLALAPVAVLAAKSSDSFDYDALSLREVGSRNTLEWRVWLEKDGDPISFWHDIPLYPFSNSTNIVNMYVEIPRWTDAKLETKRDEPLNPIFHDDKDDTPRFVASVWPHKSYPFLYGSLPQTWEDSTVVHNFTGYVGDNDPMDVFDISAVDPGYVGQVRHVKVLGGLAMIDDDTTDWKAIVIDIRDPLAELVDTVEDLDKLRPGLRKAFHEWFIYYKVVRGNGLNTIVGQKFQDASVMGNHIAESHHFWQDLIHGETEVEDISIWQTSRPSLCKSYVESKDATKEFKIPRKSNVKPPAERPSKYDQWYYLDEDFEVLPGQDINVI